jgi:hypothetical protein
VRPGTPIVILKLPRRGIPRVRSLGGSSRLETIPSPESAQAPMHGPAVRHKRQSQVRLSDSTMARSVLPSGPSRRWPPPISEQNMPMSPHRTARTMSGMIDVFENGGTSTSGKKSTMSERISPALLGKPPKRLYWSKSIASSPSSAAQAVQVHCQRGVSAKSVGWSAKRESSAPTTTEPAKDVSAT